MSAQTVLIHLQTPPGTIPATQAAPHTRRSGCVGTSFPKVGPRVCTLNTSLRFNGGHSAFPGHPWSQSPSFRSTAQSNLRQLWTWHRSTCPPDVTRYSCSSPCPEFHLPWNAEQFPGSNMYSVGIVAALSSVCWEVTCMEDRDNWRGWVSPSVTWIPGRGLRSSSVAATAFRCWAFSTAPQVDFQTPFAWIKSSDEICFP